MDALKSFRYLKVVVLLTANAVLGIEDWQNMIGENTKKGYWHDHVTDSASREATFALPEGHTYDFLYNSTEEKILMGGTTADNSYSNIHESVIPIIKHWFGDSLHFVHMRPSHSREKDLDDWGCPKGSEYRPTMVKLFVVSSRFANKTAEEVSMVVACATRSYFVFSQSPSL
uniref:Uncharacterized protein n=1 Tax=Cacopsylla melanoneura TaxID=428564 RepID=A0A8D8Z496_9HEMI